MNVIAALGYFAAGVATGMGLFVAASIFGEWLRGKAHYPKLTPRENLFTHVPYRTHTGRKEWVQ